MPAEPVGITDEPAPVVAAGDEAACETPDVCWPVDEAVVGLAEVTGDVVA